jgi:hypothetical protein
MRIQELVGTSVASGGIVAKHLKQMVMQPTRVTYQADSKTYALRSDDFIMNLIGWRNEARKKGAKLQGGVHPVSMLGLYTTPEAIGALFSNKGFVDVLRTFDDYAEPGSEDNPDSVPAPTADRRIGGYYMRPKNKFFGLGKRQDPSKGYIALNREAARVYGKMPIAEILGHEYMHRGLAMANWNQDIYKFIKAVSTLPTKPPFDAWGSSSKKDKQIADSEGMGRGQLATLEHMMMYAYEGRDSIYIAKGHHKFVPGFEKYEYWRDTDAYGPGAKNRALAILNLIGKGVEQYMIDIAKKINSVPEEKIGELIYFWAKKRGVK